MIEMPSSSPPGPTPIQPQIPDTTAVPPTKSHCFSIPTSLTDEKNFTGGSTGLVFCPNTSDLRLRSFSSPMIPVFSSDDRSLRTPFVEPLSLSSSNCDLAPLSFLNKSFNSSADSLYMCDTEVFFDGSIKGCVRPLSPVILMIL